MRPKIKMNSNNTMTFEYVVKADDDTKGYTLNYFVDSSPFTLDLNGAVIYQHPIYNNQFSYSI
jgi:hypothetical protein